MFTWNAEKVLAIFDAGIANVQALYNARYADLARIAKSTADLAVAHHGAMLYVIGVLNDIELDLANRKCDLHPGDPFREGFCGACLDEHVEGTAVALINLLAENEIIELGPIH